MHVNPLVGAAAVGSIPGIMAAALSYLGMRHTKEVSGKTDAISDKADENNESLKRVERATNGQMTARIREAVRDELIRSSAGTEEMRLLMDTLLRNMIQGEEQIPDSNNTIEGDDSEHH